MNDRDACFVLETPTLPSPKRLKQLIQRSTTFEIRGRVSAVVGDNIEAEGLNVAVGSICEIQSDSGGGFLSRVTGFSGQRVVLAPLERALRVNLGDRIRFISESLEIPVGESLSGRTLDAFGRPVDGERLPRGMTLTDADAKPPKSYDRPTIRQAIQTGVRAIDSILTCGRGQRLGIFAGSGVGKTTLIEMLARGCAADRVVICLIGERGREVREFIERCMGPDQKHRTTIVVSTSDEPAAQRVAAAMTATALAESFRDQGDHVVLLMDSITRLAMAQRELGLAAGEPPTTRGYPPSVFNLLPRLVERSGPAPTGSITAFYSVLVEGDDPNEPIADSLRGLLDGHIVLNRKLSNEGVWPPVDVLSSSSRLQPHLVSSDMMAATKSVRSILGVYEKHRDLISIGAYQRGTDPVVDKAISLHPTIRSFLMQNADDSSTLVKAQQELIALLENDQKE